MGLLILADKGGPFAEGGRGAGASAPCSHSSGHALERRTGQRCNRIRQALPASAPPVPAWNSVPTKQHPFHNSERPFYHAHRHLEVNVGPWTPCSTVPRKKSRRWSALRMSAWCCFSLSPRRSLPLANAPTTFSVSAITERLCVRAFAGRVHKAIRAVLALQTILRPRRKPRQGLLVSASREAESTEEQPKP